MQWVLAMTAPRPETLLAHLPTACAYVAPDGVVSWVNARATAVLGGDVQGKPCAEVLAPLEMLREAASGGRSQFKLQSSRGEVELGFQVSPLAEGFVVVFQDITEFQRLRVERDRLMQLAAVGDVLPALLHELKNPLAAVRSAVEVLIEEHPSGDLGEQLHAVLNEIRRMGLVLDGVGRMKHELPSARFYAIDQCVREAFAVLTPQAVGRGIVMEQRIETLPLLPFDASAMRAIVFNLVTNAIHACRPGDSIQLRLARDGDVILMEVKDSGAGMTAEVRAKCTELFFTTKARGSGIGLALVQDLTASAAGSLTISSEPGRGTTMVVRLPLPPPQR